MASIKSTVAVHAADRKTTAASTTALPSHKKVGSDACLSACCVAHGTPATDESITTLGRLYPSIVVSQKGSLHEVQASDFAPTVALASMAEDALRRFQQGTLERQLVIKSLKLCKMHRSNAGCKLGAACRNVHLCREVDLDAPAQPQTPVVLPSLRNTPRDSTPVPTAPAAAAVMPTIPLASSVDFTTSSKAVPKAPSSPTKCLNRFARRYTSAKAAWRSGDNSTRCTPLCSTESLSAETKLAVAVAIRGTRTSTESPLCLRASDSFEGAVPAKATQVETLLLDKSDDGATQLVCDCIAEQLVALGSFRLSRSSVDFTNSNLVTEPSSDDNSTSAGDDDEDEVMVGSVAPSPVPMPPKKPSGPRTPEEPRNGSFVRRSATLKAAA